MRFPPLNGGNDSISAHYGDCFISGKSILIWDRIALPDCWCFLLGFIEGSEIVVYVSLAAKQGTDIQQLRRVYVFLRPPGHTRS